MKNLTEFINLCNSKVLPTSEMYNFIQEYTNNFDIKSLEYLRNDLNKYTDNVKFTFLEDTVNDGTVDRPTTVFHYLKIVNEIAPFVLTPRQKINLILNDLQEQQINYYDNESIFSYEFDQFLKFTDMVEQEYKDRLQQETKAPDTNTPTLLIKSLTEKQQTYLYKKHTLPTIDKTKYNSDLIFEKFNNVVFKCSKDCFFAWLVDGFEHPETIEYILKGRKSVKTGLPTLNLSQLRKFIEKITGNSETTKDAYYKAVFGLEIKTSTIEISTNLNSNFKDLKKCEVKK